MAFDLFSFVLGVVAGVLTGGLAGVLHGLESTADLHEKLRHLSKEVERLKGSLSSKQSGHEAQLKIDELDEDLKEIHEEIKKMYKRTR